MKSITLDELEPGFKFKLDSYPTSIFMKLDRNTTPNGDEFYKYGDILCAELSTGVVCKMESDMEITYFYREFMK